MTTTRRALLAGSAAVVVGAALDPSVAQAHTGSGRKPTVVLVHGAFADASGWNGVLSRLIRDGYPVIAPANPLRGVASDSAYLAAVLATLSGPLVLVSHSYGGMVVTNAATGNPNVKALVYVDAFVPDQGETLFGLQTKYPGSRISEQTLDFRPYGEGRVDAYVKKEYFHDVFAADLPKATTELMWAGQRPVDTHALEVPSGAPAWKTVPSWYLVGRDDQVLPPAAQRFMARRARAHTLEVDASHVAMIAQPAATAALIKRAAR
ncbi:alpha/beta hydrolase [Streptomyces sp. S.PB5]|uniref:alpha/beta fold hydrolase n=1 Tax=Streptomyces sp. S.PB5 TaxID=3020844 RepID=UPI0025B2411D|nr:alpha/beta hydrolase [Streptomyces sp. S.PB5]MDN3021386.1 alpha/beta hydrolase [Streptomyces sp. S.PB5]